MTARHALLAALHQRAPLPRDPNRLLPQLVAHRFPPSTVLSQVLVLGEVAPGQRFERRRGGSWAEEKGMRGEATGEGDDGVGEDLLREQE
jgi:hypothetical protein